MTEVYVIRHAEAEGNLYRRIQGQYDGLLTEMGKNQLPLLKKRFADVKLDAVYSSDLTRAMQTADAVAEAAGLRVIPEPGLREVAMGEWEDKCWGEVEDDEPQQISFYNRDPEKWSIPGREAFEHLQRRIAGTVLGIAAKHPGGAVAVVTHGGAIRALMAYVMGVPANEIWRVTYCDNTAVSLFHVDDDGIKSVYLSDNSHLTEELSAFKKETWWKDEKGSDGRNMRFLPFDPEHRGDEYLQYYRDAWIAAHGSDEGFSNVYLQTACRRARKDPGALMEARLLGERAGLVELAPDSPACDGGGHIAFLYMRPEFRHRRLGVQLIGYAVHYYRKLGRSCITLKVAEENTAAQSFYKKYGFQEAGTEWAPSGDLIIMRKDITK